MHSTNSRSGDISNSEIRTGAFTLARTGRVMTISTCNQGSSWAAPVYYMFSAGSFYFFSNKSARHIRDAEQTGGQCAAALFYDDNRVENIKGLQMQGTIEKVDRKVESYLKALEYVKKFQIECDHNRITEFFSKAYNASLYKFVPESVFYMDNSIRFGFRQSVAL